MGKVTDVISAKHREFIENQHLFFVSTAPLSADGHINLSPKGLDAFKVLDDRTVAYMDLVGSGNETSAHVRENGRITFMFCAFEGKPKILRLYGTGHTVLPGTEEWERKGPLFEIYPGTRQIIVADIDRVQTSCGFGVPLYEYLGQREMLFAWADKKGSEGLKTYVREHNLESVDGLTTELGATLDKLVS